MDTMTITGNHALGQHSSYPDEYSPGLLVAIARAENRAAIGLGVDLPFQGVDIWNAWELTWLENSGRPNVATLQLRVPAESPNIIESKSLKLYLNSYSMSRFDTAQDVCSRITSDLSGCADAEVVVSLGTAGSASGASTESLPGNCIDDLEVECNLWDVDASLLQADQGNTVSAALHSNVLRSLCPVTSQPDFGSVLVNYEGPEIDPKSLLRYIVSFRKHKDFHETCVERIFLDIKERCRPTKLAVYARFQRRGGIDINPFRADAGVVLADILRTSSGL